MATTQQESGELRVNVDNVNLEKGDVVTLLNNLLENNEPFARDFADRIIPYLTHQIRNALSIEPIRVDGKGIGDKISDKLLSSAEKLIDTTTKSISKQLEGYSKPLEALLRSPKRIQTAFTNLENRAITNLTRAINDRFSLRNLTFKSLRDPIEAMSANLEQMSGITVPDLLGITRGEAAQLKTRWSASMNTLMQRLARSAQSVGQITESPYMQAVRGTRDLGGTSAFHSITEEGPKIEVGKFSRAALKQLCDLKECLGLKKPATTLDEDTLKTIKENLDQKGLIRKLGANLKDVVKAPLVLGAAGHPILGILYSLGLLGAVGAGMKGLSWAKDKVKAQFSGARTALKFGQWVDEMAFAQLKREQVKEKDTRQRKVPHISLPEHEDPTNVEFLDVTSTVKKLYRRSRTLAITLAAQRRLILEGTQWDPEKFKYAMQMLTSHIKDLTNVIKQVKRIPLTSEQENRGDVSLLEEERDRMVTWLSDFTKKPPKSPLNAPLSLIEQALDKIPGGREIVNRLVESTKKELEGGGRFSSRETERPPGSEASETKAEGTKSGSTIPEIIHLSRILEKLFGPLGNLLARRFKSRGRPSWQATMYGTSQSGGRGGSLPGGVDSSTQEILEGTTGSALEAGKEPDFTDRIWKAIGRRLMSKYTKAIRKLADDYTEENFFNIKGDILTAYGYDLINESDLTSLSFRLGAAKSKSSYTKQMYMGTIEGIGGGMLGIESTGKRATNLWAGSRRFGTEYRDEAVSSGGEEIEDIVNLAKEVVDLSKQQAGKKPSKEEEEKTGIVSILKTVGTVVNVIKLMGGLGDFVWRAKDRVAQPISPEDNIVGVKNVGDFEKAAATLGKTEKSTTDKELLIAIKQQGSIFSRMEKALVTLVNKPAEKLTQVTKPYGAESLPGITSDAGMMRLPAYHFATDSGAYNLRLRTWMEMG